MRKHSGWGPALLASLAVATAGCSDNREREDQTPSENLSVAADTSEGFESNAPAPVVPVQGGPLTATGNLRGIAENAPPGTVTVTEEGEGSRILVSITRYTPGTVLEAEIAAGTCDAPGEAVQQVGEPFRVGPDGIATLDVVVPVPTATLLDGRHSVRVTNPGQDPPQMVLACADLPSVQG